MTFFLQSYYFTSHKPTIFFSRLLADSSSSSSSSYDTTLIHGPYLDTLPSPSQLRTPLHFTGEELDALRGTNLYGATNDRRQVWEAEWEQCRADVSAVNVEWGKELTWCVLPPNCFCNCNVDSSTPPVVISRAGNVS